MTDIYNKQSGDGRFSRSGVTALVKLTMPYAVSIEVDTGRYESTNC